MLRSNAFINTKRFFIENQTYQSINRSMLFRLASNKNTDSSGFLLDVGPKSPH